MIGANPLKIKLFFKSIWRGILGIAAEMVLVSALVLIGLVVSMFWWVIIR